VNDASYPDKQKDFTFPSGDIQHGLPHTLRDVTPARLISEPTACEEPSSLTSTAIGPVRLGSVPDRTPGYTYNDSGSSQSAFAPSLHQMLCERDPNMPAVWELDPLAPDDWRGALIADLGSSGVRSADVNAASDELIEVIWEGPLTLDVRRSQKTNGRLRFDGATMILDAAAGQLCSLGVEAGDILSLRGCTVDNECGLGESCVIHPDAAAGVAGMCVRTDLVTQLEADCREIMIASRRFTITKAANEQLVVVPRLDVLAATPIEGCTDDAQCNAIESYLVTQAMMSATPGQVVARHTYACDADPGRGGTRQCITTCAMDSDCQEGAVCDAGVGRCFLGVLPPPQCVTPSQNFEVLAGNAFSVTSTNDEYRGRQVVDAATGLCVEDKTLSPLINNRFHRVEPACTDQPAPLVTVTAPNPCSVDLQEPVSDPNHPTVPPKLRPARGIRVRSPGLSFDVTDVAIPYPDGAGLPQGLHYTPINGAYSMVLDIAAGFAPMTVPLGAALPSRIRRGPDGSLWVIDSGDLPTGAAAGQVIQVIQSPLTTSTRLQ
jgi:hypothetical protein